MHGVCRLSRRWHQQFYRSPSFACHQQCLQILLPVREYRQATKARTTPRLTQPRTGPASRNHVDSSSLLSKSDIVVREYEPDADDTSKLNRIEPNQEITDEMLATRAELMKLDEELAVMRQGPFGPESEFMQSLPVDEREKLLEVLAEEGILQGEQEDLFTMAELERLGEEAEGIEESTGQRLGVTLRIPRKDQAYTRHFNKALQAAEDHDGADVRQNLNLWRWYLRCQQQVRDFSTIVSEDVWQFLWKSQAELKVRPKHLVMLANDMLNAERTLTPHQWLTYIKSLHACQEPDTAIKVWQNQKTLLRNDPEVSRVFWETGIQIYADINEPHKAQELALSALSNNSVAPESLIPVIIAWARSESADAIVKAWACYLKLRDKAGDSMLPDMYERISNALLDNKRGDLALSVFKDMLLIQEVSAHDSKQIYKQAAKRLEAVMQNATTEEQINQIGLSTLLFLPRSLQNKFFFTSWIKKLIGEKRLDSAAKVVELMYERGIAPDARPLNGIIGAWLRDGSSSARRKAEVMAWSMIEARAAFVSRREATSRSQGKHYRTLIVEEKNSSIQRKIPCATIETFSILLQHYTRRQDSAQAQKLTNTMIKSCQIQPNSYIMNHWLYGDLRAGRLQVVWDKYCNLKRDIKPDLETYAALWDTAKVQLSKADARHAASFPSARQLFAEMKDWFASMTPQRAANAQEEFSAELYEQIIRCFCLSTDLPGTLLAIHHIAHMFHFYPTDNTLRLICGQAARLLPQESRTSAKSSRTRRSQPRNKSVMVQVADVIETIEAKKKITLINQGADRDALEDQDTAAAQEVRLATLTEFICMFMQKTQAVTGSYRNDVKIAAQAMHVELEGVDLGLGD